MVRAVQDVMAPVGYSIYKSADRMDEALGKVLALKAQVPQLAAKDPHYLAACHVAESMVLGAEMFYRASLAREESRGWHLREDFPERDDAKFLKWIELKDADGEMTLSFEDVPVDDYPLQPEGTEVDDVIKFQLISRRKPGDTQEKYFYEWGIIHVALMITTPSVMRTFKRYAQHFTVNGVDGARLLYPLSDMAWDNFADHWLERPEDNLVPFESDDYMQRMHPHNFGDSNFVIEYLTETLRDDAPGFEPGGVKLDPRGQEPPGPERATSSPPPGGTARGGAPRGRRHAARPPRAEPPRGGRQGDLQGHAVRARRRGRVRGHRGTVVRGPRCPPEVHPGRRRARRRSLPRTGRWTRPGASRWS